LKYEVTLKNQGRETVDGTISKFYYILSNRSFKGSPILLYPPIVHYSGLKS